MRSLPIGQAARGKPAAGPQTSQPLPCPPTGRSTSVRSGGDPLLGSVWSTYYVDGNVFSSSALTNDIRAWAASTSARTCPRTRATSLGGTGRGLPDVAALAGGDTFYHVPRDAFESV